VVAIVTVVAYLLSPAGSGVNGLEKVLNSLPHSNSIAALEAERQQIIVMNAAASTLSQGSQPQVVNPSQIMASEGVANQGNSAASDSPVSLPPPDPGTAQKLAFDLLPSFGFNQTSQWGCLDQLWQRESGWEADAENPSGAFGIPQSLPGSKMASAGSDWMTNPATQIKWGLGYITQVYATPCNAWSHEEADGFY
jgi:hypothetical protein